MRKLYVFILLFACLFALNTSIAQNKSELIKANNYLAQKGEVYFSFNISSPSEILILTNIISIDNVKNNKVWAYANRKNFPKFLEQNIPFEVLPHPGDAVVDMWDNTKGIWQFDTYPTYSEYETMMQTFATNYPNICKLDTVAILPSGHKLLIIKITDNPGADENEPEFLYTGTMHGDETTGYVLFLRLINYLTTNYGTDSRVTNIVNNVEIWICPLANPDGTYFGGDNTVTGAIRENGSFVDLNRNYPDPRTGQHPDSNAWQPETVAWMNFADNHDFVMSANTHGGASVANYPWDTWTSAQRTHADDSWWQFVSKEFADTVFANGPAGYFKDVTSTGYTEGGDWYIITGGRQDYMNYFKHCREETIELSTTKTVAGNLLPNYWGYLYRSFLNYIEQSLYGVRGIITDACTGNAIKALVTVNSHDVDSSQVYSSLPVGNYHRPIIAGTYSITYSATGYQPQTITGITVANKSTVIRDVQLSPLPPVASFTADHTTGCVPDIQFTSTSQAPAGSSYLWDFGDGQSSTLQNALHSYVSSGSYSVTLTVSNSCSGNDQIVITNYINLTLPTAPTATSVQNCGPIDFTITATGNGTINWYDAPSAGNLIHTGTSYHTPTLTTTTTYYLESVTTTTGASQYAGKVDNVGTGGNHTTANYGLYFDVLQDINLVSVKVYSSTLANRTIVITDGSSNVVYNQSVSIPNGESRITLNAFLPAGTGYSIICTTTPNLYRDGGAGAPALPYPYTLSGVVSITGNPANNTAYYYYFYDWEVQTQTTCTSARTPVTATINPVPIADAGNDVNICYGAQTTLTATGGVSFIWSNGWTFNQQNISPNVTTTYTVTVTNAEVCTATDAVTVTVLPELLANAGVDQMIPNNSSTSLSGSTSGGTGSYSYHWEPASLLDNPDIANPTTVSLSSTNQFILTITDLQGCIAFDTVIVALTTSADLNNISSYIKIYPNPSNGYITVENSKKTEINVIVTDIIGKPIIKKTFYNKNNELNLSPVSDGMYFITINNENKINTISIIISKY